MGSRLLSITRWSAPLLACASLALAFALEGYWAVSALLLALVLPSVAALFTPQTWVPAAMLFLHALSAAAGFWLNLHAAFLLLGLAASLAAWDIDHFARRLKMVDRVEPAAGMVRRHLVRLLSAVVLGFLLAAGALWLPINLGFGAAFVLGLLAILGIAQGFGFLRRSIP